MNGHKPWTKISMSEPCSLTWKRRSIKCGTRDYLSSLNLLESTIVLYRGSGITCLTVINASKLTIPHQRQSGFMLAYLKVPFLSPLLFIIYMNDIASLSVQDQASFTNLFADDTSLYVANGDPTMLATELQQAVDNLSEWFDNWLLNVNIEKTALLILRKKGMPAILITVRICGDVIHQVNKHKHLGLILNCTLTWKDHVDYVCSKAAQRIGLLHRIRKRLSALAIRSVYLTSVRPVLEYAAQLAWCGLSAQDINHLERLQRRAARVITGVKPWSSTGTCHEVLLAHAGLPTLSERRLIAQAFRI